MYSEQSEIKFPNDIEQRLKEVFDRFKPCSMFVYGSYAVGNNKPTSDVEIGIVFDNDNRPKHSDIKKFTNHDKISIYPFLKSDLEHHKIDTPFERRILIHSWIIGGATTLHGEKLIENLKKPVLKDEHFLHDTFYNLGMACSAFQIRRDGRAIELANELIYKSCFYTLRNLLRLKTNEFILHYDTVWKKSKSLSIPDEYHELIDTCNAWRTNNETTIDEKLFLKNVSFINKFAIPQFEKGAK